MDTRAPLHRSARTLLLIGAILLLSVLRGLPPAVQAATTLSGTLVQVIDTSRWDPPSTDPSGITYWPAKNHLLLVDGEVEESPHWAGANVFQSTLAGRLLTTYSTIAFTSEPVGIDIAVGPSGHFFVSDDSHKTIYEIDLGADGVFGTADDVRRSFLTSAFGNQDPEGLTLGQYDGSLALFTVDGLNREVWISKPGPNGRFDGAGDDVVTHFDVDALNIADPEGIEYDSTTDQLYIIDRGQKRLNQLTTSGTLLGVLSLTTLISGVRNPSDVALAPSSNSAGRHLYIVDRGVDNNQSPGENDGKVYEIALTTSPPPSGNLLVNGGFELDTNNDNRPDSWTTSSKFTRSTQVTHGGSYAGRLQAQDNSGATIAQTITNLAAGKQYSFAGWVNIPSTSDAFTLKLQVRWINGSGSGIRTDTVQTYSGTTGGWKQALAVPVSPAGTAKAQVRIVVSNLNATIYLDDFSFQ